MAELTADRLKQLLHYEPETGVFTRIWCLSRTGNIVAQSGAARTGAAGTISQSGYIRIYVAGRDHFAHRLAWLYTHGEWPNQIDHINGDRCDNRIANLRSVTAQQNSENRRSASVDSKTGLLGVVFDKARGKYVSYIRADGKSRNLGGYDTAEAAHEAYLSAKREHHAFATV